MDVKTLKGLVETAQRNYMEIQGREYDDFFHVYRMSHTAMWEEASRIGPSDWWEIIRVLAQGGEYYSIQWTAHDGLRPSYRNEEGITIQC